MDHHGEVPELPEVETIRRQLASSLPGRRVEHLDASWAKTLVGRTMPVEGAGGLTISGVFRRGKVLVLSLDEGVAILIHLRMTGQLLLDERADLEGPMTRAVISLDRGRLVFNDQRKFGRIVVLPSRLVDEDPLVGRLGPEPLDAAFGAEVLGIQLGRHRSLSVKAALLDQSTIAGIGNIYADEALFGAGIHPARRCDQLDREEIARLSRVVVEVLRTAIAAGGSTLRDYRDASGGSGRYLEMATVFGRTGLPCRRCGSPIVKIRVAGRGTHLCPTCQPEDPSSG
jgi:formamidopyrimidine-DNA glycosylase